MDGCETLGEVPNKLGISPNKMQYDHAQGKCHEEHFAAYGFVGNVPRNP